MEIGRVCFSGDIKLTGSLAIPASVKTFNGDEIFKGTGLSEIIFNSDLANVPQGCFQNCKSLNRVRFASQITQIQQDAFNGCSSLNSLEVGQWSGLTKIGVRAFKDCSSLNGEIRLSRSCDYDMESSFENCGFTVRFE